MHFSWMDAYFHLAAHGDKEAYELLYREFVSRCKNEIKSAIRNYSNLSEIPIDFGEYVDDLFFKVINEYDSCKGSFTWYVEYMINTRLSNKFKQIAINTQNREVIYVHNEETDGNILDNVADPNQMPIATDIAINNFKYYLASPRKHFNKNQRIEAKIILLQYAGYTYEEICDSLKMTRQELRTVLKRIKGKGELINLKLELK